MRSRSLAAFLGLLLVPCLLARDIYSSAHPTAHKMWGGTVSTSGVLVNLIGVATTESPDDHEERSHYLTVCNRSSTDAEVIAVNVANPTSVGSVDWGCGGGADECDPQIAAGASASFDDALLFQVELDSVSGSPITSVYYGRNR